MTRGAERGLAPLVRAAVARGDLRALRAAARAADPKAVVKAWPSLSPLQRVALFRSLDAPAAARVFSALDADGKWLAYLAEISEGAAPLLDGKSRAPGALRRAGAREISAMRRALRIM